MTVNLRIGRLSQTLANLLAFGFGYGGCLRCHTPWNFVEDHTTWYKNGSGCLPLCEKCWTELTPRQRLPFYRELIESWYTNQTVLNGATLDETWDAVQNAVLNGR